MEPLLHPDPSLVDHRDVAISAALGLAALGLYLSTPIGRIFGDGSLLITLFAAREFLDAVHIHALYLPAARALEDALHAVGLTPKPADTLLLLSQLSGAFGIAMAFLVARGFGAPRRSSALAVLLLMVSPPIWFFADTTEVHTLHFATVGCVAVVTLFGPWRRPVLATLLMTACLPLLYLSHQSGLLLYPGWPLLAQVGRCRVAPPLSRRALLWGVAPAALLALVAAMFLSANMRSINLAESMQSSVDLVTVHLKGHLLQELWSGWLKPLGLLLPLLGLGAWRLARSSRATPRRAALALLVIPSLIFFITWGVPERGAYSLGTAVFLTVLTAVGIESLLHPRAMFEPSERSAPGPSPRRLTLVLIAAAILLQASSARHEVLAFDRPEITSASQARAAAVQAAFADKQPPFFLISLDPLFQTVTALLPKVRELSLGDVATVAILQRQPPADFAQRALAPCDMLTKGAPSTILIDRGYVAHVSEYPGAEPYIRAFEDGLRERYHIIELPGPGGGFWQLAPRPEGQPAESLASPR